MTHERQRGTRGQWGGREGREGREGRGRRGRAAWAGEFSGAGWGPPGRRARRGDVRRLVLAALQEGPAHGYDLMQRLEAQSGGLWRPSPGSVYPLLQLLEDQGIVSSEERDGKRLYQLTEAGQQDAETSRSEGRLPWEGADETGQEVASLREASGQLLQAARQVGRAGGPDQIRRSIDAVRLARKTLYEILAED